MANLSNDDGSVINFLVMDMLKRAKITIETFEGNEEVKDWELLDNVKIFNRVNCEPESYKSKI